MGRIRRRNHIFASDRKLQVASDDAGCTIARFRGKMESMASSKRRRSVAMSLFEQYVIACAHLYGAVPIHQVLSLYNAHQDTAFADHAAVDPDRLRAASVGSRDGYYVCASLDSPHMLARHRLTISIGDTVVSDRRTDGPRHEIRRQGPLPFEGSGRNPDLDRMTVNETPRMDLPRTPAPSTDAGVLDSI